MDTKEQGKFNQEEQIENIENKSVENESSVNEETENSVEENNQNGVISVEESVSEVEKVNEPIVVEEKTIEEVAQVEEKVEETVGYDDVKEDTAEVEVNAEENKIVDFTALTKEQLIESLNELVNNSEINTIKNSVDAIKASFYIKHRADNQEAKNKFLEEGGGNEDFKPEISPLEIKLKELLNIYREKRTAYIQNIERERQNNLKVKYQIIEEIKDLINGQESMNKTFNDFKDLQARWRDSGLVPQSELKNLWETYHHNVEKFYDFVKINKELRDLDLKKNLEAKIDLCEKAEKLLLEPKVIKAFRDLQVYHERWREIGPTPLDKKEEIWERFKEATTQINKNHQDYFEQLKEEHKTNLEAKTVLCEKLEEISNVECSDHKSFEAKSNEIIELQKVWKTIGLVPKKNNTEIYNRFKAACDVFFDKKKEFYGKIKEEQKNNLQIKTDLCVQAETLQDSTEWKSTTNEFLKLQKRWKEVGAVSRKQSDVVWKRFRAACDKFFNSKSEYYSTIETTYQDNLTKKIELIENVKAFTVSDNSNADLDQLQLFQKEWSDIGHVPFDKKEETRKLFRDTINAHYKNLKVDESKRSMLDFKNKLDNLKGSNQSNKIYHEEQKIENKIKKLINDITIWENNIGFFSNSSKASDLIKDVNRKIERAKAEIKEWKEKLKFLREN